MSWDFWLWVGSVAALLLLWLVVFPWLGAYGGKGTGRDPAGPRVRETPRPGAKAKTPIKPAPEM